MRLSYEGYTRQLATLDLTPERRARLEAEVELLKEELATLEKLARLGRAEPDRGKIEAMVRERLDAVRVRLRQDASLASLSDEERDYASGEVKALLWALGEDPLTLGMQALTQDRVPPDQARTNRAVAELLVHTLREGPNVDARASAAYELGVLHVTQAIPALAAASLDDEPLLANIALRSLCLFTREELERAGLSDEQIGQIERARRS